MDLRCCQPVAQSAQGPGTPSAATSRTALPIGELFSEHQCHPAEGTVVIEDGAEITRLLQLVHKSSGISSAEATIKGSDLIHLSRAPEYKNVCKHDKPRICNFIYSAFTQLLLCPERN